MSVSTLVQFWLIDYFLILLLLSHFSRVQLCATLSLGFFRQDHWSGLPFPSPMHKSEKWKWSHLVMSDSSQPHGLQPTRLLCPWDFPDKSTGVGCHCLLQFSYKGCIFLWGFFSFLFFCMPGYFWWILDIVNFILLGIEHFCYLVNIFELSSRGGWLIWKVYPCF